MRGDRRPDDAEVLYETGDPPARISCGATTAADGQPTWTMRVEGELCRPGVEEAQPGLTAWYRAAPCDHLHLDLSGVTFIDARGLHLVIALKELGDELGRPLVLADERTSRCVRRLLAVCGLAIRASTLAEADPTACG